MYTFIVVISLFALFFSAAGYLRTQNPQLFETLQKAALDPTGQTDHNSKIEATQGATQEQPSLSITPVDALGNVITTTATYEEFSPEKIRRADTAPVVLFFHASWCPSCLSAERIFQKKLPSLPPGVSILKIDFDSATELKQRYNITYQHTFIQVDSMGNELARWSGGAVDGVNANLIQK
jgi:thiol-disulfide isomerase/thioredoxin